MSDRTRIKLVAMLLIGLITIVTIAGIAAVKQAEYSRPVIPSFDCGGPYQ